jgi:hypothetical protein
MKVGPLFTPLERSVVDAVLHATPGGPREQLLAQVQAMNRIQRFSHGKEVNLYCLRHGRPAFPERLLFSVLDELELARVTFTTGDGRKERSASVRMVNGRLFSIIFAQPPGNAARGPSSVRVTGVRLGVDPNRLRPGHYPAERAAGDAPGEPGQPMPRGPIDALLPADYLEVLSMPQEAHGFVIHDPEHLRLVALDSFNCYILAERGDQMGVGIIQGREDGELHILDFAKGSVRPAGHRLLEALSAAQNYFACGLPDELAKSKS